MGHLTDWERYYIECDLRLGLSNAQIAQHLGRSVRTIQRERLRGARGAGQAYSAQVSQRRRAHCAAASAANHPTKAAALWAALASGLAKRHSPAQVIGAAGLALSVSAAYRWVQRCGQRLARHLRHGLRCAKAPSTGRRNPGCAWVRQARPIAQRPAGARLRSHLGHLECDSLVGRRDEPCKVLGWVDRASGWVRLGWVPDGSAKTVAAHIAAWSSQAGLALHTLTCDQGSEFTHLPALLPARLYVCEPGKPYQKGAIENLMGLLRQYLPKGKSLKGLTQVLLDKIAHELNHRPRKRLGWQTPAMIVARLTAAATV